MRLRGNLLIELFDPRGFDEGAFLARLYDPKVRIDQVGHLLRRYAIKNTITFAGSTAPLVLLAQNAGTVVTDYQLAQFVVGTNPTPPSRGDTALGAPVSGGLGGVKALTDANRVLSAPTGELIVSVSYGTTEANVGPGLSLVEAGVFMGNGGLFARQVNPGVPKTNAFVAGYTWRFGLTT